MNESGIYSFHREINRKEEGGRKARGLLAQVKMDCLCASRGFVLPPPCLGDRSHRGEAGTLALLPDPPSLVGVPMCLRLYPEGPLVPRYQPLSFCAMEMPWLMRLSSVLLRLSRLLAFQEMACHLHQSYKSPRGPHNGATQGYRADKASLSLP